MKAIQLWLFIHVLIICLIIYLILIAVLRQLSLLCSASSGSELYFFPLLDRVWSHWLAGRCTLHRETGHQVQRDPAPSLAQLLNQNVRAEVLLLAVTNLIGSSEVWECGADSDTMIFLVNFEIFLLHEVPTLRTLQLNLFQSEILLQWTVVGGQIFHNLRLFAESSWYTNTKRDIKKEKEKSRADHWNQFCQ